jgi:hypothetical protein
MANTEIFKPKEVKSRLEHTKPKVLAHRLQTEARIKFRVCRCTELKLCTFLRAHGFCLESLVFVTTHT